MFLLKMFSNPGFSPKFTASTLFAMAALMLVLFAVSPAQANSRYIGEIQGVDAVKDKVFDEFYRKAGVDFSSYSKVMIEPVTTLFDRDKDLKDFSERDIADRQTYLFGALAEGFAEHFEIVDAPGPGVLIVKASITSLMFNKPTLDYQTGSKLSLDMFSSFYVGRAAFQADIRDGQTGALLAVVVDSRRGHDLSTHHRHRWHTWGDANQFMDRWAKILPQRLTSQGAIN